MVVCAWAEDKQVCLHGNSRSAHAHLRDTPIFNLIKKKLPSRIIEVPDNRGPDNRGSTVYIISVHLQQKIAKQQNHH